MTRTEILCRDAVLRALDQIVVAELGDKWSLEAHMVRKAELLAVTLDQDDNI
jgi:hypothetical protein